MKDFFKSVFASALGTFLAVVIACCALVMLVVALASSAGNNHEMAAVSLKPKTMLVIGGGLTINDTPAHGSPGLDLLFLGGNGPELDLLRALEAVDLAAKDRNIAGILLSGPLEAGVTQKAELRKAIAAFKASGKPVIAWIENGSQGEYYLSSVADKVYVHAAGELELKGLSSYHMYFGETLKMLGIGVQVTKVGKYKSAVEPYIGGGMSEPARAQSAASGIWRLRRGCASRCPAYDMRVSDAIYGHPQRYVSRQRLEQMLDHEYGLLVDRLKAGRGPVTRFFAFADTVATTPHDGKGQGHSWIGIRFQDQPQSEPSEVILHLRLWDKDADRQQDALGAVGVNLIHAALNTRDSVDNFLTALVDEVGVGRVEVEFAHFSGPAFGAFDNRAAALRLVRLGLTDAVLFGPEGDPQVPSEYFYKRSVLVARGTFRPVSIVNEDMLACALRALPEGGKDVIPLFEMCIGSDPHPESELIDRIRLVGAMQHLSLIHI
jgi:hypothetical protein